MHNLRGSGGRRADQQRESQFDALGHVRKAPASNGHRPTAGPERFQRRDNYGRDGHGYHDPSVPSRHRISWPGVGVVALIVAANILAVSGTKLQPVSSVIGLWFILLYPVYLLYTTSFWAVRPAAERVGYSVAVVLLLLMVVGLAFNTVLPPLGVQRPLGVVPVAVLGDAMTLGLVLVRRQHRGSVNWWREIRPRIPAEARLIGGAVLCVVLAVLGANRLNNDAGALASIIALTCMAVLLVMLLWKCQRVRDGAIAASLYFVSLALLLLTSLRGWYISGHDIQLEYRVFQLVEAHGRWDFSLFANAYNGCLSITILPTEIADLTNIDNAYVFKVIFQIIFAFVPVLVYTVSRRFWSKPTSILAAVYFISLPNFFTDMTYENRQEIAFVFVCVGILSVTNASWRQPQRRTALLIAAVGVELSHYSTTYLFLGAMASAWIFGSVQRLLRGRTYSRGSRSLAEPWTGAARTVGIGTLAAMFSIVLLWSGLVTHTADGAVKTVAASLSQLFKPGAGSTPQYDLFSRAQAPSESAVLATYGQNALSVNQLSKPGTYISPQIAEGYTTPLAAEPIMPLTRPGRLVSHLGFSAAAINMVVRGGAAKDEQLFLAVGLAAMILTARLRRRVTREYFGLCVGSAFVVGLFTVFPNLSTDYGSLRAFQEALIVIAPVLVEGSLAFFRPFGDRWSLRLASAIAVLIFISTTGLMPQLLGGYAPQLSLNNSGDYYDEYYLHPQESAAVAWLAQKPGVLPDGLQAAAPTLFAFTSPPDVTGDQVVSGIYPLLIQKSSWVVLNYAIVHDDRAIVDVGNDAISYKYPVGMLQTNKNLVYNNGGAEIYR